MNVSITDYLEHNNEKVKRETSKEEALRKEQ